MRFIYCCNHKYSFSLSNLNPDHEMTLHCHNHTNHTLCGNDAMPATAHAYTHTSLQQLLAQPGATPLADCRDRTTHNKGHACSGLCVSLLSLLCSCPTTPLPAPSAHAHTHTRTHTRIRILSLSLSWYLSMSVSATCPEMECVKLKHTAHAQRVLRHG